VPIGPLSSHALVEFVFDLLQGVGIAAGIGIRPFLPVLLTGALASANVGLDFDGTSFSFLEEWPFLLAVLVLVAVSDFALRRRADLERGALVWLLLAGASILFPPLAILVLAGLGWLLAGGRRREGEKYAGLRILR
jgi:hypothetical protein